MQIELTSEEKRQKFLWEARDLVLGALLPFIIMLLFSCTIIMFADSGDLAVRLVAVIGGNILLAAAYVIFGRKNGATAYNRFYVNQTKRSLNSKEKAVLYKTGEYALWKGFAIPLISCIPYIIFQLINIFAPNAVCNFALRYAFGWAYYPFGIAGLHEAVNFVMIIVPVAAHVIGYYTGMRKEERIQAELAEQTQAKSNRKKRRK